MGVESAANHDSAGGGGSGVSLSQRRFQSAFTLISLLFLSATILAAVVPLLPPGVCFDDAGDLQLAAATLGIPHPPGYPGYVFLAHFATRIPGVDPAYAVSVTCLLVGLVCLLICAAFQIRLGVNPFAAATLCLLLAMHSRFWANLRAPEVYTITLALIVGSGYAILRGAQTGRRGFFYLAALLFGTALINRPPVLFGLPFFLAAWWKAVERWESIRTRRRGHLAWCALCGFLPAVHALGYIWIRDAPSTDYNYIDQHNAEWGVLPSSDEGIAAKAKRTAWLLSARQFSYKFGNSWGGVRTKLRWLGDEIDARDPIRGVAIVLLVLVGFVSLMRRSPVVAWIVAGLAVHSVVFICFYNIHGQAADILPFLFAVAVCAGTAMSVMVPASPSLVRNGLCAAAFAIAIGFTVADGPLRPKNSTGLDATDYLADVDMATMPVGAVICTSWTRSLPLHYARILLTPRPDVTIITADPVHWPKLVAEFGDRPLFAAVNKNPWPERTFVPFRKLWRVLTLRPRVFIADE